MTTASDGKKYKTKYYNLDVIFSVGYRVKSQKGIQFRIWANQNLKEYTVAEFDAILKLIIRYTSVNLTSNKLRFYIGGSGTTCGTGMINTKYNSDSQQQQQVGDDYRTQRFPAGSAVAVNTYYLKARRV